MEHKIIEQKVKEAIAKRLSISIDKINLESYLMGDLAMDSFAAIEIVFELEESFGLSIPENDLADVKTVKDIIEYIARRVNTKIC